MADSHLICSINGCGNRSYARSFCNSHYLRWRRHGDPLGGEVSKGEPLRWLKAIVSNPPEKCVVWPYASNGNGYGWAWYSGSRIGAHRLSLVLSSGKNPKELDASHSCHNRSCVNPNHLFWKSRRENLLENRSNKNRKTKLTEKDAEKIRASDEPVSKLATHFGVSKSSIYKIKQNRNWKID